LGKQVFWSVDELEQRLDRFYQAYNYERVHASIAYLPPMTFWLEWEQGHIERKEMKNKTIKFRLTIPYHEISGNGNQREVS
jgi:hypothetical protein